MADPMLDKDLREMSRGYHEGNSRLKMLKQISRVVSIGFVIVLLVFVASLYTKARAMYAPENFTVPLQDEMQYLLPRLEPELRALWNETAPVYGELALEKFETALPQVQEASQVELEALLDSLSTNAEKRIEESLSRILSRQHRVVGKHFPSLTTSEGIEELGARWQNTLEVDSEQVLLHFHDLYAEDLGELQATLEQFRLSRFEELSKEELTRQFIHLWLMKIDRLVTQSDEGKSFGRGGTDHGS
jgi:hypothetical protein